MDCIVIPDILPDIYASCKNVADFICKSNRGAIPAIDDNTITVVYIDKLIEKQADVGGISLLLTLEA